MVWTPALYDLDSLWGVSWDGVTQLPSLHDTLSTPQNKLWVRLWDNFGDELRTRYSELRNGVLSLDNIQAEFAEFSAGIPAGAYSIDKQLWNSNGSMVRTYDLMFSLVDEYLPQADALFHYGQPEPEPDPVDLPDSEPVPDETTEQTH